MRRSARWPRSGLTSAVQLVFAIALLAALLGACGGDDDGDEDQTSTPGSTETAEPTEGGGPSNEADEALEAIDYPEEMADGTATGEAGLPTLQMFEDFQCPFCLRFTAEREELLMEYVRDGKLRVEFRNLPILGQESVNAAAAAVCAAEQDGFWPYHNKLFQVQAAADQMTNEQLNVGRFALDALVGYAGDVGLDEAAFGTCLEDPATIAAVQTDFDAARDLGLRSTPTFVLDGQPIQTPRDEAGWRDLLDDATE
jgi:protein-disulfide isomerase